MAPRNLSTSVHSSNARLPQSQATPAATALPSPSLVGQSNTVSVQDILFGVLTIVLAIASVLLAYLQLVHMRNQARSPRPGTEMLSIRKHTFPIPYTSFIDHQLDGPSRQDSSQSSASTSDDTVVDVEAPQEPSPVPHSAGRPSNAAIESEIVVGIPSRETASLGVIAERRDYGKSSDRVCTAGPC